MSVRRAITLLAVLAASVGVVACGGGGGGGSSTSSTSTATTYTSVAMAGDLVTYSVDTTKLTYSYTITSSQFGLQGHIGSGTLTKVANNVYTLSNIPGASLVQLPNGLLLGAVRDMFGTSLVTVPIVGLENPVNTFAAAAGLYNFVQRSCISSTCQSYYGTFQIDANGTWASCPSGNLAAGSCPSGGYFGTLNALGNGQFEVLNGTTDIGTALAMNSSGQNVVILDLTDTRSTGFGVGILVGSSQQSVGATQADGQWLAEDSLGNWGTFTVSGTAINYNTVNGLPSTSTSSVTYDTPWAGFATTSSGGVALLAGTGVFVYEQSGGYGELGLKFN